MSLTEFNSLEIPLASSNENILNAIEKLENFGCVTEFDKILNNFAIEHWKEYHLDILKNNGYTGKVLSIGGYDSRYGAYYGLWNPQRMEHSKAITHLKNQLQVYLDNQFF